MLKLVVPDHMSKYFPEGENMLNWGLYNKLEIIELTGNIANTLNKARVSLAKKNIPILKFMQNTRFKLNILLYLYTADKDVAEHGRLKLQMNFN